MVHKIWLIAVNAALLVSCGGSASAPREPEQVSTVEVPQAEAEPPGESGTSKEAIPEEEEPELLLRGADESGEEEEPPVLAQEARSALAYLEAGGKARILLFESSTVGCNQGKRTQSLASVSCQWKSGSSCIQVSARFTTSGGKLGGNVQGVKVEVLQAPPSGVGQIRIDDRWGGTVKAGELDVQVCP